MAGSRHYTGWNPRELNVNDQEMSCWAAPEKTRVANFGLRIESGLGAL